MADGLAQSFDFAVRIVQLVKWLEQEEKAFPQARRLLECGTGLGITLRTAKSLSDRDSLVQAIRYAEEVQFLLELMVKTEFITELQSGPLRSECKAIKKELLEKRLPLYRAAAEDETQPARPGRRQ